MFAMLTISAAYAYQVGAALGAVAWMAGYAIGSPVGW